MMAFGYKVSWKISSRTSKAIIIIFHVIIISDILLFYGLLTVKFLFGLKLMKKKYFFFV